MYTLYISWLLRKLFMCRSELPHSVQRFIFIFGKVADTEEQMWNWLIIMFIQYHEAIFQFFFLSILFLISDQHHIHPHSILVGGKNVTYVSVPMIPEVAPPPLMQRHIINIVNAITAMDEKNCTEMEGRGKKKEKEFFKVRSVPCWSDNYNT